MESLFGPEFWSQVTAFFSVVAIDLVLAGDNAVVVGMAAAGLPADQRRKAVIIGIAAAAGLRIIFAIFTTQLLAIIGLLLAGGILLVWVCWKLWREILAENRRRREEREAEAGAVLAEATGPAATPGQAVPDAQPNKTLRQAIIQIIVADVSMSLDNVLAVAGAARDHIEILIIGLALSVVLMGVAATVIARLLKRHHWIAYVGLIVIIYVALKMIYEGGEEVLHALQGVESAPEGAAVQH